MLEWLLILGSIFLWMLFGLALCFSFVIILSLGHYEIRPRQRKQERRRSNPNPPRGGTSVQRPQDHSPYQPSRAVRCAEYEALGGTPIIRDGEIVGYSWEGASPVGFQVESVSPGMSLTLLGTTITLENPDGSDAIGADAPVWGGENKGWHWEWDVETMVGQYVRDAPHDSLEDA